MELSHLVNVVFVCGIITPSERYVYCVGLYPARLNGIVRF
jgi:hypothetical protein